MTEFYVRSPSNPGGTRLGNDALRIPDALGYAPHCRGEPGLQGSSPRLHGQHPLVLPKYHPGHQENAVKFHVDPASSHVEENAHENPCLDSPTLTAAVLKAAMLEVGRPRPCAAQRRELMDGRDVRLLQAVAPQEFTPLRIPLGHGET